MCVDPDWMPYERIDEQGKHVGIAADFMSEFQKRIPVPIELVLTESWKESLEAAKSRQCDILSLLNESPQRREFLNFTDPYLTDSVVIVARNDVFYLDGLESLSGRKLGVVDGYVYEEKIRKQYPEIIIIPVKSVGDALRKVSDGKIYATLDALFIITSNIQKLGLSNLKIAGQTGLDNAFRVGVRKDDPILLSVFDKLIKNLDDTTRNAILRSWYTLKFQHGTDWRMVWQVTAIAIIILCLLGYITLSTRRFNRKLAKANEHLHNKNQERMRAEENLQESEQELKKANDELEQRVEARTLELKKTYNQLLHAEKLATSGSIAASLAHEFGNPLYGIKGVLTSIAQQETLPADNARMVVMAMDECDRMSHLLQSLQDFNRPTSGEKTLTNLNRVIDDIIIFSRRNLERKAIVIKKEYDPVLRPIMVITDQIKQVIMNLINNSIHACAKGGVISISTSANENNDIIRIRDNGHGIKENDLPHIFEPFFTTKDIAMGTGLGLSVSYGIIRRHGGTIEVKSKPGEGATFTITLPTEDKEDK